MPAEVVTRPQSLGDPRGVLFEVDAIDQRSRREARPVQHDQFELVGERLLRCPGAVAVPDAAVDEDDPLFNGRRC